MPGLIPDSQIPQPSIPLDQKKTEKKWKPIQKKVQSTSDKTIATGQGQTLAKPIGKQRIKPEWSKTQPTSQKASQKAAVVLSGTRATHQIQQEAKTIPHKQFVAGLKAKAEPKHLARLGEINDSFKRTGKRLELQKLGFTQNPVTKMQENVFLPRQTVQSVITASKLSLNEVPSLFSKEELISSIRLDLNPELEPLLVLVKNAPEYISEQELAIITKSLSEPMKNRLFANLKEYVSSYDILATNQGSPAAMNVLKEAAKKESISIREFIFKIGLENHREILATEILQPLGLSEGVAGKYEVTLKGVKFDNTNDPQGIASSFLQGDTVKNDPRMRTTKWKDFLKSKQKIRQLKFEKAQTPDYQTKKKIEKQIQTKEANNKQLAEQASSLGYDEEIRKQIFIDILLCNADGHIDQYIGMKNIDLSRFLGPEYFTKEGQTFCLLRSSLLDHSAATAPMPNEEQVFYKALVENFSKQESALRARVGTAEFFKTQEKKTSEIREALSKAKTLSQENVSEFLNTIETDYQIKINRTQDLENIKDEVQKKLEEKGSDTKAESFKKIHPDAFKEMQERVKLAKTYLESEKKPTMLGITFAMYPDLEVFIEVLRRSEWAPFGSLAIGNVNGIIQYRPLETIRDSIWATAEEKTKMQEAIDRMQKKAQSTKMLEQTMDLVL